MNHARRDFSASRVRSQACAVTCITSGHLCTSPRVIREADALTNAGYKVTVVSASLSEHFADRDANLADMHAWDWHAVHLNGLVSRINQKAQRQFARFAQYLVPHSPTVSALAHSAMYQDLANEACKHEADFIIGHNLPGLVAAVRAGERSRTPVIFDVEDWHPGEIDLAQTVSEVSRDSLVRDLDRRQRIMDAYIRSCSALIASSPLIADHLKRRYTTPIVTVCNASDDPPQTTGLARRQERIRAGSRHCYWFSQTVGLDRGLEDVIPLLAKSHPHVSLTLQGAASDDIKRHMNALWQRHAGPGDIRFLPLVEPQALAAQSARFDFGLSLETTRTLNHRLCLSNKLFAYLEWGMPQVISNTPSQRTFALDTKQASLLIDFNEPKDSADRLAQWFNDPGALCAGVDASNQLYQHQKNYAHESGTLIDLVARLRRLSSTRQSNHAMSKAA